MHKATFPRLPEGVTAIAEGQPLSKIRRCAEQMIEYPAEVSLEWVLSRNWAVVPVADQPDLRECEWICEAAKERNVEECVLMVTEPRSLGTAAVVKLQTTTLHQALHFEHLSLSNLALFPFTLEFLVIKEAVDYFLIAGPRDFVVRAVGSSLAVARQLFDEAAERTTGDTRYAQLAPIAERYRPFDG